jgi:hypothetical protein
MKGVASSKPSTIPFNGVKHGNTNLTIDGIQCYQIRNESIPVGVLISHIPHCFIVTGVAKVRNVLGHESDQSLLHLSSNSTWHFSQSSIEKPSCDGAGVSYKRQQVRRHHDRYGTRHPARGNQGGHVLFDSNCLSTWKTMNRASAARLPMIGLQALGLLDKPFCIWLAPSFIVLHGGEEYRWSDVCTLGLLR